MNTRADDIDDILAKARMMASHEVRVINVRRAHFYGVATVELPAWLSELWLLGGHWANGSSRYITMAQLIKDLEAVRELVCEPQ